MPTTGARPVPDMRVSEFLRDHVIPAIPGPAAIYGEAFGRGHGRYRRGPCPIHNGTDDNFSVDAQTLRWQCFSACQEGGDVLDYLRKTEQYPTDFIAAVRRLAETFHVSTDPIDRKLTPEESKRYEQRKQQGKLLEDFAAWSAEQLKTNEATRARDLLHDRGVARTDKGEPIDYAALGVGYYPSAAAVKAAMLDKEHDAEAVEASGLLKDRRWEGRLLAAINDERGELVSFIARDTTGRAEPKDKYLKLAGATTPPAFNLDRAFTRSAGAGGAVWVVESPLDVVTLRSWGFDAAIATAGNFGQFNAKGWGGVLPLASLAGSRLILATDDDDVGRKKLADCLEKLRTVKRDPTCARVYVVDPSHYPDGCEDPGDIFKQYAEDDEEIGSALAKLRADAEPWHVYLARQYADGLTPGAIDPDSQSRVIALRDLAEDQLPTDRADVLRITAEASGYTEADLEAEAERVREHREREANAKAVADAARTLAREAGNTTDPHDLREMTRSTMAELSSIAGATDDDEPEDFDIDRLIEEMRTDPPGLPTGLAVLDAAHIQLRPSELIVFAARPGHGKTALLAQLLHYWTDPETRPAKHPVLFISSEEPEKMIARRLLAFSLRFKSRELWDDSEILQYVRGNWTDKQREDGVWTGAEMEKAIADIRARAGAMKIIHRPAWTADRIAEYAQRFKEQHGGCSAVLVDYWQRIPSDEKGDRRDIDVANVGRRFKYLAHELGAPVVVGAQINREADKIRPAIRAAELSGDAEKVADAIHGMLPELHHLREGGEQEADVIFGLLSHAAEKREKYAGPDPDHREAFEIVVLKNRHGSPGECFDSLTFNGRTRTILSPTVFTDENRPPQ